MAFSDVMRNENPRWNTRKQDVNISYTPHSNTNISPPVTRYANNCHNQS